MISLIAFIFIILMRKKIKFWGDRRQYFGGSIIRQISEDLEVLKKLFYIKNRIFSNNLNCLQKEKQRVAYFKISS